MKIWNFYMKDPMENAHTKTGAEVLRNFEVDLNTGLNEEQILKLRSQFGPNGVI